MGYGNFGYDVVKPDVVITMFSNKKNFESLKLLKEDERDLVLSTDFRSTLVVAADAAVSCRRKAM